MRKKWIVPLVLFCAALGLFAYAKRPDPDVVRLHVIANSDDPADQAVKLQVRDVLLRQLGGRWNGADSASGCLEVLRQDLPDIEALAAQTLEAAGIDYGAQAQVGVYAFPTRTYNDSLTLPGGRYQALRVELGQAQGKNWWCLLYPPLCLDAVDPSPQVDGVSGAQAADVLPAQGREEATPQVRSWIWDKLRAWLE